MSWRAWRREAAKPRRTSTLSRRHSSKASRFSPVIPGWRDAFQPGRPQRADSGVARRAGALDVHVHLLQPLFQALAGGRVGGHLGGKGGGLARALEARAARRLPGDDVALRVRERHDRVVEGCLDVGLPDGNVLLRLAPPAGSFGSGGHYYLPARFLPATCMRRGPLRVRALVFVFWPRTDRPRRWGRPR